MLDPNSANYWLQQSLINGEKALQQTIATGHAQDQAYRAEKNSQHVAENLNIAHHNIAHLKNELDQAVEINKELLELLADWMVSQKAFKELAIQFGIEKGLTPDEIRDMGIKKESDVLLNNHNPSHKTNSSDLTTMQEEVDRLKLKAKLK